MRLNRDGTIAPDGEETRLTRFSYKDDSILIGGVPKNVEVEVSIVGEFDREIAITKNDKCMVIPVAVARKILKALTRAVVVAPREERYMQRRQDADSRRLDLRRLKDLRSQVKSGPVLNQSEQGELEKLEALYRG